MNLNQVIEYFYLANEEKIVDANIRAQKKYFSDRECNPLVKEFLKEKSYEAAFLYFKDKLKEASLYEVEIIFTKLKEIYLFSSGHDLVFKERLKAICFMEPMRDLIYPMMSSKIHSKYNDVSVMEENPNYDKNMRDIDRIVYKFFELGSLMNLLYVNDFQFPNKIDILYPDIYDELLEILNESGLTIGDYLYALIDYKCDIMKFIFKNIKDINLRIKYLSKISELRDEEKETTQTFAHFDLPITYFLDHNIMDMLIKYDKNKRLRKILLSNDGKDNKGRKIELS